MIHASHIYTYPTPSLSKLMLISAVILSQGVYDQHQCIISSKKLKRSSLLSHLILPIPSHPIVQNRVSNHPIRFQPNNQTSHLVCQSISQSVSLSVSDTARDLILEK